MARPLGGGSFVLCTRTSVCRTDSTNKAERNARLIQKNNEESQYNEDYTNTFDVVGDACGQRTRVRRRCRLAQDNVRQEPHHYKREAAGPMIADVLESVLRPAPRGPDGRYPEGSDGGYRHYEDSHQDGYHFGLRHGFYDGLHGRSYENRANSRSEYAGYDEGYQRGKDKLVFMQGE
jgi:hypothetical protein